MMGLPVPEPKWVQNPTRNKKVFSSVIERWRPEWDYGSNLLAKANSTVASHSISALPCPENG
jgi:hypothetical protein